MQLKNTIVKAFQKAGITEADEEIRNLRNATLKRNASLSEILCSDERDDTVNKRAKLGNAVDAVVSSTPVEKNQALITVEHANIIGPGHEHYSFLIHAAAEQFFQTSVVKPAQQIKQMLDEQAEVAKKKSVPKPAKMSLKNPNTTTGLAVTSEIVKQIEAQEAEKLRLQQAKVARDTSALDKRLQTREAEKHSGEKVLSLYLEASDDWKKIKIDKLKQAYRYLTNKEVKHIPCSSTGLKKEDVILALSSYLNAAYSRDLTTEVNVMEIDGENVEIEE